MTINEIIKWQSLLSNMKENLLNLDLQNSTCCSGCDLCCNIIVIQRHDFAQAINQVCTLLCNSTCWLYIKFMQHWCNWTITIGDLFMWHHHKWTFGCLCTFYAIDLWSSSYTLVKLNCQSLNLFMFHNCNWISWLLACAASSQLDSLYSQYIVSQQQ